MANLPETPQWEDGIYQIEVSDPVLGGPDGISNRQAKQLAKRTSYLKQQVESGDKNLADHIAAPNPHTQYAPKESPALSGTPTAPTPTKTDNSTKLATTGHVKNVVADYAPLASPALTGKPTAPTAAQASNDTQLATTAFVKAALAALVASSPEALDTLNELAAALGNDPNFATTMTNALAGKQPLDNTLTALSGKSVSALLEYLGLVPGIILPEGYNIPAHIVNTPGIVYSAQFPGTYTNEPAFGGEWFDVYAAKHVSDACTLIAVSRTGKIATGSYSANTFSGWNYSLNSSNTTQAGRDLIGKESKTEMVKYLGLDTIPGCLLNIKTITTSGMYTPTAGTKSIIVEAVGGGGASGNLTATGTTQNAISAAGSNGAYAKARYTSGFSSVSVTVGAGGTVNGAGGGNGGDGGTTSFGSLLVCPAGKGSGVGTAKAPPFNEGAAQPSSSPSGTGIIISRNGPFSSWPTVVALGMGSNFANSIISPLAGYGLGGDGVASNASEPARNGNPGSSGVVIVWEYS